MKVHDPSACKAVLQSITLKGIPFLIFRLGFFSSHAGERRNHLPNYTFCGIRFESMCPYEMAKLNLAMKGFGVDDQMLE
jgi:hypothetical protein